MSARFERPLVSAKPSFVPKPHLEMRRNEDTSLHHVDVGPMIIRFSTQIELSAAQITLSNLFVDDRN